MLMKCARCFFQGTCARLKIRRPPPVRSILAFAFTIIAMFFSACAADDPEVDSRPTADARALLEQSLNTMSYASFHLALE